MKRVAALAVVAGVLLSGCAVRGLAFSQDHRVDIVEPLENDRVRLPLELRWTASTFDGYFGVFFDQHPMRPNEPLLSLVPEDDACRSLPACPDAKWLSDRSVYVTKATRIVLETIPDLRKNERSSDRHDVTIVLLDNTGHRIGESAFVREFIVERQDS